MSRFAKLSKWVRACLMAVIGVASLAAVHQVSADISALVLGNRSCGSVTAYVQYDSFSEGNPPFYAVFAADLNGNGVYGEAGEPVQYILTGPGGTAGFIRGQLNFPAVPSGTVIAVTAYEIDSAGNIVSPQLTAVRYTCIHRPATDLYPPNTAPAVPGLGVSAKISVERVTVYDAPSAANGHLLGGLPIGAIVNVIGRNSRGDWLEVQFNGGVGWIMWETNAILFGPYQQLPVTG